MAEFDVNDTMDWERWHRSALQEYFTEMMSDWRLYLSKRRDHRKPHEKSWRAHTLQPYPWVIIEGKVAAVSDVVNAADPMVQAEGVGDEDVPVARKVERLLDNTLRANQWRLRTENLIREAAIQGTAAIKVVWRHDVAKVRDDSADYALWFDQQVSVMQQAGFDVPVEPSAYEQSRKNLAQEGIEIPQHPRYRYLEVTTFRGPSLERVALTDLRFDPLEEYWHRQRKVMHRIVKTKKFVMDLAGDDPSLPFDRAAVERAINALPEGGINEWQAEVAHMMGLSSAATGYPNRADLCELYEVYDPEDEECPYKVILNRTERINKDPFSPYGHGEIWLHLFRNVPQPNSCLGIGELKAPRKLFHELWSLRDLRLDAVTLATLPIFQKLSELGIPDVAKIFRPGGSIPVPRMDALKRLELGNGVHPDAWREVSELKAEIDDASSVYSNLRGAPATVGRVSASEAERRFSSAMLRMKTAAVRFEEEFRAPIRQCLYLWFQHGDPDTLGRAAGEGLEAYAQTVTKEELAAALDLDFNLRGASRVVNRDMLVQQIMQWFTTFGAIVAPHRQLALAKQAYETMGLKNRGEVIPDEDILAATPQPVIDPTTGQPMVDPATGQPMMGPGGQLPAPPAAPPAESQPFPSLTGAE